MARRDLHQFFGCVSTPLFPGGRRLGMHGVVVEPGAHFSQLTHGDLVTVRGARHIPANWIVKADSPLVHQLQNGRGGKGFGDAADTHRQIGCHGLARTDVANSERPDVRRFAWFPHADNDARNRRLPMPAEMVWSSSASQSRGCADA